MRSCWGEVLALRTILINLMFSLTNGKPVTPEAMRELIEKADGDKSRRAMERLTAVAATVPEPEPNRRNGSGRGGPDGGMGTEGIQQSMAEPEAGVDHRRRSSRRRLALAGMLTIQYERSWTAAEGLYWKDYLKSGTRARCRHVR